MNTLFSHKYHQRILLGFMVAVLIAFIWALFFLVIPRAERAEQATDPGCVLVGSARDLNTIFFYDCNGEIKMKRVK